MNRWKALWLTLLPMLISPALAAESDNIKNTIKKCNQSIAEGNASNALTIANDALRIDPHNHDALLCQGRAYADQKQFPQALQALQASEQSSGNANERLVSLLTIGNIQKEAGSSNEALQTYQKGLTLARSEKDAAFERISLNLIGETQLENGQGEAGLQNYLDAAALAASDNERGESYSRIAAAYDRLGKRDQAIEYQIKAMLMQERAGERDEYANAGLELGRLYTMDKEYANAENAINKILKFARDNGSAYWEARANYYLGLAKAGQGDLDGARTLMLSAHHAARQIGATSLAGEINNAMMDLMKK